MAGIYIHVPFCKQACHYCNFHFSTSLKYQEDMVESIIAELILRKQELGKVSTLYFGGGTPSLLSGVQINSICDTVAKHSDTSTLTEITLEANPDDLTTQYLNELQTTPINRLSIGVQSFFDADLQWMNRAHNAVMAEDCIKKAQDVGLDNITIDLIYGSPTTTDKMWRQNLEKWNNLKLPHLSSYALTVEPGTALSTTQESGKTQPVEEETAVRQFLYLQEFAKENNINHYEISNFCTEENYAKHNTNYWFGAPYVGIGPSAHSYDGKSIRRWNVANNVKYMKHLASGEVFWEQETLSDTDQHNEYLMTRLRTKWGVELADFGQRFGKDSLGILLGEAQPWISREQLEVNGGVLKLPACGQFVADSIISSLFK